MEQRSGFTFWVEGDRVRLTTKRGVVVEFTEDEARWAATALAKDAAALRDRFANNTRGLKLTRSEDNPERYFVVMPESSEPPAGWTDQPWWEDEMASDVIAVVDTRAPHPEDPSRPTSILLVRSRRTDTPMKLYGLEHAFEYINQHYRHAFEQQDMAVHLRSFRPA